ncbi:HlyC/CorC family transporter [Advenella sp. WQ 585]|uniref:Polyamine export protein n=1 Tax=Advenella mandrilli TaxID=2800330 RepID=A0ABS1EAW0_9BURK|nr:hemolysin family protein [Advenella mandrilli]MBK1780684.1 HlyC/CorC family transporter [Advenella mandrilli]
MSAGDLLTHVLFLLLLIIISGFFSISEISLAASRKIKLRLLANDGIAKAQEVLALQENPGNFFTVIQIGQNAVAIMAGIVGESALSPYVANLISVIYSGPMLGTLSFLLSFLLVTASFVMFSDLIPKRLAMAQPEKQAMAVVKPMKFCMLVFAPLVWLFSSMANLILRLMRVPQVREEEITRDDIVALAEAGAQGGGVLLQEQYMIRNVFEMDSRIVPSAMTPRESIVYLSLNETEEDIRQKIAEFPHGKFPVCQDTLDHVIGYVDSKDILPRILQGKDLSLRTAPIVRKVLVLPDTLTLFEALEQFRAAKEDFSLVVNEYALVVGLLSLQDVMNTVMGDLVGSLQEEWIVKRDDHSWLVDGMTPIEEVMAALTIKEFEGFENNYETMAGFIMYKLRKVPRPTDFVLYEGYKFEVVDIDNYRIDQVLVTRHDEEKQNLTVD